MSAYRYAGTKLDHARRRVRQAPPGLILFFLAMALLAVNHGIFETVYNNYLNDTFQISATARGQLEFPRELPGLLTVVMTGLFVFLGDKGLGTMAAAATALGMAGLGALGGSWWPMVGATLVWSIGNHLIMPVRDSVAISLAHQERRGRRLGQLGAVSTFAMIGGFAMVYLGERVFETSYRNLFWAGAAAATAATLVWMVLPRIKEEANRPRLVVKRKYWLFYMLALLFGARKQIFITFGPWVLVRVFQRRAYVFAQLQTAGALVGMFFQPLLGQLIDRWGERRILVVDAALTVLICLGYGFAERIPWLGVALGVVYVCYVADQVLFAVGMARTTYMSKIAERPEDVTPSLSLGVSVNHVVSMSIPALGGMVWDRWGYAWVFVGGALIALLNMLFAAKVRTGGGDGAEVEGVNSK